MKRFLELFHVSLAPVATRDDRYYYVASVPEGALSAGDYLGTHRGKRFLPSLRLLELIAQTTQAKSIVRGKAAWLFLCGRDVLPTGIISLRASQNHTIVCDEQGNVLGYGRVEKQNNGFLIKNLLDKGDFLRREKH